uniref:Putative secreted protein n=1 Tax=Amblyomma triste TaxID=251400 RepID=A0A023G1L6_AMBTT
MEKICTLLQVLFACSFALLLQVRQFLEQGRPLAMTHLVFNFHHSSLHIIFAQVFFDALSCFVCESPSSFSSFSLIMKACTDIGGPGQRLSWA